MYVVNQEFLMIVMKLDLRTNVIRLDLFKYAMMADLRMNTRVMKLFLCFICH
jgi:hypothetical protein